MKLLYVCPIYINSYMNFISLVNKGLWPTWKLSGDIDRTKLAPRINDTSFLWSLTLFMCINIKKYSSYILDDTVITHSNTQDAMDQPYVNLTEDQVVISLLFRVFGEIPNGIR